MSAITDATADVFTGATRPTALARSVAELGDRQVLLIAGDDDPLEVRVATRLAAGAPDQVEVWTPADTPHVGARAQHPDAWEDRVVGFLERALS